MFGTAMSLFGLLSLSLLLGFAYILWALAAKEGSGAKLGGQILAVLIAVLAIAIFLYSGMYGGKMKSHMHAKMGMCPMTEHKEGGMQMEKMMKGMEKPEHMKNMKKMM